MVGLVLGRRLATVIRDDHVYIILMAAMVGVTSGAAAAVLLSWIESANQLFIGRFGGVLRWTIIIAFPVLGGLAAGGLRVLAVRVLRARPVVGPMGVIAAVAKRGGRLHGRGALISGLGTGVSIGSGGSCGHEGPSVAIGAAVGSVVARFFGLRLRRHVAMVGAGCAGGLAAAFNVRALPTLLLIYKGEIRDALVGARPPHEIRKKAEWLEKKASGRGLLGRLFS